MTPHDLQVYIYFKHLAFTPKLPHIFASITVI